MAVASRGEHIFAKGYGLADLQRRVPAEADTIYRTGYVGKQFTAAALVRLPHGSLSTVIFHRLAPRGFQGQERRSRHLKIRADRPRRAGSSRGLRALRSNRPKLPYEHSRAGLVRTSYATLTDRAWERRRTPMSEENKQLVRRAPETSTKGAISSSRPS